MPTPSESNSVVTVSQLDRLVMLVSTKVAAGEPIEIDRLTADCPEQREQLEMLLPTLVAMADLGHSVKPGRNEDRQAQNSEPLSGATGVLGDFRIIREIGRGGMGVVYEAEQISLGRPVALKVLPFAALLDERQLMRFRNESRWAAMLKHPSIVSVHSVGCERGVHFYVMELIQGKNLAELVHDIRAIGEGTSTRSKAEDTRPIAAITTQHGIDRKSFYRSIARLGLQAAHALHYAHQEGVIHRDIKPSNLLLDNDGKLFVADFGMARANTGDDLTMSGDLLGTLKYMSPEQLDQDRIVDHRTDIYSLGLTLYELVSIRPAFATRSRQSTIRDILDGKLPRLSSIEPSVPADLETIIAKATASRAEDRYLSASALHEDLQRFLNHRSIQARRATNSERLLRWLYRSPYVASLCGIVLGLLLLVATLTTLFALRQREFALSQAELVRSLSQQDYFNSIRSARAAIDNAEYATAIESLDHIRRTQPAERWRSFEYRYLRRITDEIDSIPRNRHWIDRYAACFSPDGKYVACGGFDGEVCLINAANQQTVWQHKTGGKVGHDSYVTSVAFSQDGRLLISVGVDNSTNGKLCLWDVETGDPIGQPLEFADSKQALRFDIAKQSDLLAIGFSADNAEPIESPVVIYRLQGTGPSSRLDKVRTLEAANISSVVDLSFSSDGRWLAAATKQPAPVVWDLSNGQVVKLPSRAPSEVRTVEFSPVQASLLAFGANLPGTRGKRISASVHAVDLTLPTELTFLCGQPGAIESLAFSSSGEQLAMAGTHKSIWLTHISGESKTIELIGHTNEINGLSFSSDGRIASASSDGTVRFWRPEAQQETDLTLVAPNAGLVESLCFHPDDEHLYAGFATGQICCWRLSDGTLLQSDSPGVPFVFGTNVSGDGQSVVYCGGDWHPSATPGVIAIIDARTLKERIRLHEQPDETFYSASFLPGDKFVAADVGGLIHIWDAQTGRLDRVLTGAHTSKSIAVSRDGKYVAASVMKKGYGAVIWDLASGDIVTRKYGANPDLKSFAVAIAPDNSTFAFAQGGNIQLTDLHTGETIQMLYGHEDGIFALDYSPDGTRLLSAGKDGNLNIWDVATGGQLLTFQLDVWIQSAKFSHDGDSIAVAASPTGKGDGFVRVIQAKRRSDRNESD